MARYTIQEAMESEDIGTAEQCIYVYHDGETVFYVGRSDQPIERLMQHLGEGVYSVVPDRIGSFILKHRPVSLTWLVDIVTVQSLVPDEYKKTHDPKLLASVRGIGEFRRFAFFSNPIAYCT